MSRFRFLAAVVLLLAACTDTPRPNTQAVPQWAGSVDLSIGSLAGTHDQFGQVTGVTLDGQGRIVVTDGENDLVSVFDSTGRFLFRFGRKGGGPGELNGPCCPLVDRGGTLWLRDGLNARYNGYHLSDTGATYLFQRRMNHPARGYRAPVTFDRVGALIDVGLVPTSAGASIFRVHEDSSGAVSAVDTIPAPPRDSTGEYALARDDVTFAVVQPYGPRFLVAHAPGGGWATALSSHYRVRWVDPADSLWHIQRDLIGPALSERERTVADSSLTAQAASLGVSRASLPFGVPGSKPPLDALFLDGLGRLWVQLSAADAGSSRADVYAPGGHRVAMAEWPGNVKLAGGFVGGDFAYGVRTDSLGVEQVVRVRFH